MIDWQHLNDLKRAIGAKGFDEVVVVFLAEADKLVARLPAAITAKQLESEIHSLRGSALNLGFSDLATICQTNELRAEAGETDLPLDQIQASYAASRAEFLFKLADMAA